MNAFIISNKNNNVFVAASNAGCELCDHTALVSCDHMIRLPLILQCVGRNIESAIATLNHVTTRPQGYVIT